MLLSAPLLGTSYPPLAVWASLVPIIAGCAISSLNEVATSHHQNVSVSTKPLPGCQCGKHSHVKMWEGGAIHDL